MTELTTFDFNEMPVRLLDLGGQPWFVAADVCRVLDISNPRDAVAALDEDEKITVANTDGNPRAGIPHALNAISESGLYSLVFRSRKEEARTFRRWVTKEVLPAIRKTGRYFTEEDTASPVAAAVKALQGNATAAERARDLVADGALSLEQAQVIATLCCEVRTSWAMRLKIAPLPLPEAMEADEASALVRRAAGKLSGDAELSLTELCEGQCDNPKSTGRKLSELVGRHMMDEHGRRFIFTRKHRYNGKAYCFEFIETPSLGGEEGGK